MGGQVRRRHSPPAGCRWPRREHAGGLDRADDPQSARRRCQRVLDAISRQRVDFAFEIIGVDSASTDGTADLLRQRGRFRDQHPRRIVRSRTDAQSRYRAGARRAGGAAGAGCRAGLGFMAGRVDGARCSRTRSWPAHSGASGRVLTPVRSRAITCRGMSAPLMSRESSRSPATRRAGAARSDGAPRPLHVRQRLFLHPPFGLGRSSVQIDANRRGRRMGEGGPDRWLQAGVRPGGGGGAFARSVGALRAASDLPAASPPVRTVPAAHHSDGASPRCARSLRRWRSTRSASATKARASRADAPSPSHSHGRSASTSARCPRSGAGSRRGRGSSDANSRDRPRLPTGGHRRHRALRAGARARARERRATT